ncbi:MAG TPA: hypothetical protein VNK52_16255 [Hyphomicrobiaceae bacterium]|nr:hypothetical protein [Hyphomicrobiaceae bacterium]
MITVTTQAELDAALAAENHARLIEALTEVHAFLRALDTVADDLMPYVSPSVVKKYEGIVRDALAQSNAAHCNVCHTDILPGQEHSCGGTPTPCGPRCYPTVEQAAARADQSLGLSVAEAAVEAFDSESREIGYPGIVRDALARPDREASNANRP